MQVFRFLGFRFYVLRLVFVRGKKNKKKNGRNIIRGRMKRKETTRNIYKERAGQNSTKSAKAREQSYS